MIYKRLNWLKSFPNIVLHGMGLLLIVTVQAGCVPLGVNNPDSSQRFDLKSEVRRISKPFILPLAAWELENTVRPVNNHLTGNVSDLPFQIAKVLEEENIPVIPAVRVRFTNPPYLLVISPREKIEYVDRLMLLPDLSIGQIETLETQLNSLNISSLVTKIGGFGAAYPAIVSPDMGIKAIINAVTEEWAHQFLALKPLGYLYLLDSLGFSQDPDIITMNETLAGIIADEIGVKVYKDYYEESDSKPVKNDGEFDFNKEMHLTRVTVDKLLALGSITEAENYMEERRVYINSNGYGIRKINQAYFAYHGIYGQDPGTTSTIYSEMIGLRNSSINLSNFIERVASMTKYSDLKQAVNNTTN